MMKHVAKASSKDGRVTMKEGQLRFVADKTTEDARFSLSFHFPFMTQEDYVFLPACAYDGNRFRRVSRAYPPMYTEEECKDGIPTVTDLPALSSEGEGEISVTSGDLSVPCAGIFFPARREGFFLFTEQAVKGKNIGFTVEKGVIRADYPAGRRWDYRMCLPDVPSADTGISVKEGEELLSSVRIFTPRCDTLADFFRFFFLHRRALLSGKHAENGYTDELWQVLEEHLNRDNWSGEFYAEHTHIWQCGWVGGGMSSLPLLVRGKRLSRERAEATLDFLTSHTFEGGLFVGLARDGVAMGDNYGRAHMPYSVLTRKLGDGLAFLFKHFERVAPKEEWVTAAKRCADALVRIYRKQGEFGQFINGKDETLYFPGTTSGASVIGALVRAWRYFSDEAYLTVAKEAAESYYRRFIARGLTYGGPGEALCAPDSESSYAMVESTVLLYEATGDASFLSYAEQSAALFSTWVMPYSYVFPEGCEMHRHGVNTVGSVFANVQNKHSAPGICTASGDALYKLYRFTGKKEYLDLLRDIVFFIPQCVSRAEDPIYSWEGEPRPLPNGFICERVNTSDWEGSSCVGGVFYGTCWCETSLALSFLELMDDEQIRTALLSDG